MNISMKYPPPKSPIASAMEKSSHFGQARIGKSKSHDHSHKTGPMPDEHQVAVVSIKNPANGFADLRQGIRYKIQLGKCPTTQ